MPDEPRPTTRWMVFGIVAGVALLFELAGLATLGPAGGLLMLGLTLFLVGAGAAIAGRARWAFIATRKVGGIVAAVGVLGMIAGTATAPPTEPTAASSGPAGTTATTTDAPTTAAPTTASTTASSVTASSTTAPSATDAGRTTALAALAAVEVKGRAPRTGYDRDLFGSGWQDTDRNGCDTRNDILARDLTGETFEPGTRDCVVLTGTLADPYSGATLPFQRGEATSDDIQIDHVVALSDAWQKGAQALDDGRRRAFANDPLNLLAVDGGLNMQKGDGDAATWLPPDRGYRCAYVARQVAVKVTYDLWMTQAEKTAIAAILGSCPDEPLPGGAVARVVAPRTTPAPAPAAAPGAYFENCTAARSAAAAPVRRGDPGYGSHLDRDGDGVGCE